MEINLQLKVDPLIARNFKRGFMNILNKWIGKDQNKILKRQKCFTYTHKNYWAFKMEDDSTEFWAYSCLTDEKWYLGKLVDGTIVECDGFYGHKFDWDIQKGALRMFELNK